VSVSHVPVIDTRLVFLARTDVNPYVAIAAIANGSVRILRRSKRQKELATVRIARFRSRDTKCVFRKTKRENSSP